ncbi:MAG: TRAP transporter large permease subunit [Alphaproteobacteria bacterium]|nr:TRAP transporter large permease subunit [Alphaproteobacteria bacterium]MDX5370707.1 TRAP transporter large permease subunit [Alphaproteobacteria bacterium]MDX5465124.1 TRAP transporter large permease subunit [Alphaproteobacteria bacterium]
MENDVLAILMFPAMIGLLLLGFQVAFSLLVVGTLFGWVLYDHRVAIQLFNIIQTTASQFLLTAVPPFILMGCILERSGVAERLFRVVQLWVGRLPGGLALTTMLMAAMIAATTGIVGAVEVMIGLMAIPAMQRFGYRNDLIAGTVCAGGSLGTMIPPSLVLIVYASVANLSVGKLFAAAILPGILMVALFLLYIAVRCIVSPPAVAYEDTQGADMPLGQKLWQTLVGLLPAVLLIFAVLGTILRGIATPTEAASVGALGALVLAAAYRRINWQMLREAFLTTLKLTSMILLIVVGGSMFSSIFRGLGGNDVVRAVVEAADLGPVGIVALLLAIVFVAGFILEWVSVLLICLPIFVPILAAYGVDPIWFAMLTFIMLQTSYLTPPMAPSIFYLKGIAPPGMTTREMYAGVVPFIACMLLVMVLVMLFPGLATWLPEVLVTGF